MIPEFTFWWGWLEPLREYSHNFSQLSTCWRGQSSWKYKVIRCPSSISCHLLHFCCTYFQVSFSELHFRLFMINEKNFISFVNSSYFSELVRTNELCRQYSEACIELCKEMNLKVVDLWTALQKREDWLTACFT